MDHLTREEVGYETSIEDDTKDSIGVTVEYTVEVAAELDIPHVLLEQTVEERLGEHEDVIQEMFDNLLEMPLQRMEEVEEEIRTLTSRLETAKVESTTLRARVRSLEMSEMSFHDTVRVEREVYWSSPSFGVCFRGAEAEQDISL
ncbi:hypothetical protein Tco_1297074 [Tanacetum coccineum]